MSEYTTRTLAGTRRVYVPRRWISTLITLRITIIQYNNSDVVINSVSYERDRSITALRAGKLRDTTSEVD